MGGLHTVFHIWEYPSLEEREKIRAAAWQVEVSDILNANIIGMEQHCEQGKFASQKRLTLDCAYDR